MMKKRGLSKRILAFMLSFMMVIALVPMNAITVKAEGVPDCQHCGGTGKVCSNHKDAHDGDSYENVPECENPCVIILEEGEYYCETHDTYNHGQCEYCKGTGSDPNWTHDHHFVYVHNVDGSGIDYHLSKCDYPDCDEYGNLPNSGYNCNTDGPDGACSVCGYKVHEHDYNAYWYNDNWHWKMCIVCSKGQQGSEEIHSYSNWNDGVRSCICGKTETCTHNGATTGTCSTCGKDLGPAHTHSQGTHHAKVDATCVATGTVEYWDCRLCEAKIDVNEKVIEDITIPGEKVITSAIDTNSNGFKGEGCENLLDSNTDTKWCCSFEGETFVVIKASEPVIISNYTITTAGDTSQYKDRNPKSWTLLACNDYSEAEKKGTWEEIDSISNGDMPNENTTAKTFNISSTKKYQYYKWNVTSIVGGPILQVSEFELHALHSFENNDANTHKCSFCNTTGEHDFSDQGDGTHKCADCGATGTHDFSVNVNETTHKCANCDATGNHNFTDADGNPSNTCIVCGYRNIEENIELYVYGIKVTEENADDINGDGKTSFDKESSTLYLKGTSDEIGLHENVVIYSSLDTLNIELEGDTVINSETAAYGIYFAKEDSNNTLDLNGHDLTINVGNMDNRVARNGDSAGIYFGKNTLDITGDSVNDVLDITSGTVTSSDYSSCGIYNNENDGTATLNIDTIKLNICCVGSNGYSCGIYILHGELNCYSGDIGISNTESGADGTNALFMAYGGNCRITGNTKVTISLVETDKGEGLVGICGGNITIGDNADVNVDINPRHSNYDSYGVWVKKLTIQDNAKVSINGAISSDYFGLHLLYFQNKKIDEEEFDFKGGHLLIKSQAKCYAVGTFYKGIINMAEGYHLYKLDENGSKSNFDYRGTYRDSDSWSNIFNSSGYSLSAGQALIIDKCEEHLFLQDSENNNHYCKYCGITASHLFDVEDTEAIGAGKSNATCTEAAKYYKSCACGLVSTDEADLFESGEPLGHDYSVPMDGDNHKCSRCDSQGIHDFINADGTNAGTEECIDCGVKNIAYTDLAINISNLIYTSEIQIPEVEIKNGDTVLVKDTDYTVTVEGKSDVGIYELKVTGVNKYRGEINKKWSIIAGDGLWCADIPDQVYTGKAIKPSFEVYCDGIKLIANKDYTLTYKNNVKVAASDAKNAKGGSIAPSVTITGKGNYADKKTVNFAIVPCSIDTAACEDITVAKTGKNIKINPVVTLDGKKLKAGTDYVVSTSTDVKDAVVSYKEAETYNLYAVGKGSYTGYVPFNFTITESILASKVTIAKIADQKYDDGKEVKPAVKITYNKKDVADKFDVTYEKNTEIGTATVIATAKADSGFTGSKKATFKITGKSITTAKLGSNGKGTIPAATYTGSAYEPELDLYAGGEQLVKNVDYTVAYSKNVNAGSATATVTGKGSYTGTKKFTFKINKYDATKDEADIIKINNDEPIIMVYSKGGVVPKPVVTMNGTVLKEKTDYTLSYANNKSVADASAVNSKGKSVAPTVNVIFKGNFSGKKSVAFNIEAKDIRVTSLVIADKAVGTKANAWKQTAVAITDTDGKKLVAGTDFNKTFKYYSDSECKNEITDSTLGAGTTVYVKVTGLNNYISEIVGSYRISMTNISSVSASIATREYIGSEICPAAEEITVTVGKDSAKKTLVAGTDYEIVSGSYTKNINKGTATVTIRGINDYYGTKVVKYTIGAKKFLWWKL